MSEEEDPSLGVDLGPPLTIGALPQLAEFDTTTTTTTTMPAAMTITPTTTTTTTTTDVPIVTGGGSISAAVATATTTVPDEKATAVPMYNPVAAISSTTNPLQQPPLFASGSAANTNTPLIQPPTQPPTLSQPPVVVQQQQQQQQEKQYPLSTKSPPLPGITPPMPNPQRQQHQSESAITGVLAAPMQPVWFFQHASGGWVPFSATDSAALETATASKRTNDDAIGATTTATTTTAKTVQVVMTDGGRCDVDLTTRLRTSPYWPGSGSCVRRGTWFVGQDDDLAPLPENIAAAIETRWQQAMAARAWPQRLELLNSGDQSSGGGGGGGGGAVIELRNPGLAVYYAGTGSTTTTEVADATAVASAPAATTAATNTTTTTTPPRIVRRGYADADAAAAANTGEDTQTVPDHLVLVIGGPTPCMPSLSSLRIGGAGGRHGTLVDAVDSMRCLARELVTSNFDRPESSRFTGRVEYLPVQLDEPHLASALADMKRLWLPRTHDLRAFLARSLLDTNAYSTQKQALAEAVVASINKVVTAFRDRNPAFTGGISLAAHGVAGVIAFDILAHAGDNISNSNGSSNGVPSVPAAAAGSLVDEPDSEGEVVDPEPPSVEAPPTVADLLDMLGLSDKVEAFAAQEMDLETLADCTAEDLKEFDLTLGKRKKLQAAAAEARDGAAKRSAAAAEVAAARLDSLRQARAERRLERRRQRAEAAEGRSAVARAKLEADEHARAQIQWPKMGIELANLFLLGAPVAAFAMGARGGGGESGGGSSSSSSTATTTTAALLGPELKLMGCKGVWNVFHPCDPHAQRLEPLVDPAVAHQVAAGELPLPPVQVAHHAGRKRLHLELKGYLKRTGTELKQNVTSWAGSAWSSFSSALKEHVGVEVPTAGGGSSSSSSSSSSSNNNTKATTSTTPSTTSRDAITAYSSTTDKSGVASGASQEAKVQQTLAAALNHGRRIDFSLQAAAHEETGLARFALQSHSSYWTSEDTVLFTLTRIYGEAVGTPAT